MDTPVKGPTGIAEIFFGPLANLLRRRRASRVPGRRVVFESLEPRILLSADLLGAEVANFVFDAPANAALDDLTLRLNADNGELELLNGASVVLSQSLAATNGVVVTGENGHDDSLTIDFAFGGVFSLAGGITFHGGHGGNDALAVKGGSFTSVTHSFTDTGPGRSGTMVYEGGSPAPVVIHYTDLEPLDMSGSTITDLVFNLPGTNDQAILEDDGTLGNGVSQLRSQNGSPTFETTTFGSAVVNLTINMGGDSGTLSVAALPDYSGALTINGEAGSDSVTFTGASSFSTLAVSVGGPVADVAGSNLHVTGNARFSGSSVVLGDIPGEVVNFGSLTATATGPMTVFESSDMVLAGTSAAMTFSLRSAGSITEEIGASIRGINATLTAGTHIGASGADPLDVDLANLVAFSGTAGSGGIFVNDLDSAMNGLRLFEIDADGGTAAIEIATAIGDISDANFRAVFGSSVVLSAGRHIGTASNALEINTGALTATSGTFADTGDINLSQQGNQALRLNTINANGGAGAISILSGAPLADLLDGNGAAVNLQGGAMNLTSGRHIGFDGTTIDALETEVTTLAARGALGVPVLAGDIHINELGGSLALDLLDAEAGNISIVAAGSITDANGAGLNLRGSTAAISAGQHIGFDGTTLEALETEIVNFGAIHSSGKVALSAAGTLTLAGDVNAGKNEILLTAPSVVLAPAAVLNVDLGGTAPDQFTRYLISGALSLGGTLDADLVDGFAPAPADRFRVMEFGSSTGAFATTDLPVDFVLEPHATNLELVVSSDPDIFIDDVNVVEGDSGTTTAVFTVVLSGPSTQVVTVDFATAGGSATEGLDYQPAGGTLSFNPGETSKQVSVTVNGDVVDEFDETFSVTLLNAVEGVIRDGLGSGVILDDDPEPTISIGDAIAIEGDTGTVNAVFAVSLSKASGKPITVDFATSDISATEALDYQALSGSVTFAPGETSKEISIAVNGELLEEADETFAVTLSNPLNVEIGDGQGIGTILDNEIPVFVEIADQTVVEGGEIRFVVNAIDDPAQALTFAAGPLPQSASFDATTREFVWAPVDDATATVTFTVTDPEGAQDTMEVVLTATNAAPTVDAGPDQVVGLQRADDKHDHHHHKHGHGRPDADVSIAAAFDDLGIEDTHVASIDWGDGTVTAGTVVEPAGAADGSVTGEHTYKKAGTYTVKVTVTDDDGGTRSDTLLVTVKKPVEKKNFDAKDDRYKLKEDTVLRVDVPHGVLANDRTPGSAPVEARVIEGPKHGTLAFNADGSFTYVPDADFHGKDSFRYEFTDGVNVTQAAEVKLVVQNVPDKKPRPCIDWHERWHAGWGHHDFLPFGHNAWKRLF